MIDPVRIIADYLDRLRTVSPEVLGRIGKPLSEASIERIALTEDFHLPSQIALFFRCWNGQRGTKIGALPLLGTSDSIPLLKLTEMISLSQNTTGMEILYSNNERRKYILDKKVRESFWAPLWFPIARLNEDNIGLVRTLFVDLDPATSGEPGQLVLEKWVIEPQRETIYRDVIAKSLSEYFCTLKSLPIELDLKKGIVIQNGQKSGQPAPAIRSILVENETISTETISRLETLIRQAGDAEPVSDQEISLAETMLQAKLPCPILQVLRVSRSWHWVEPGFDSIWFLPPTEIAKESIRPVDERDEIEVEVSLSIEARPMYYSPSRFTIAHSDYFKFQYDVDPTPDGNRGQVVMIDIESGEISLANKDLESFLRRAINHLEPPTAPISR